VERMWCWLVVGCSTTRDDGGGGCHVLSFELRVALVGAPVNPVMT
jgi:hypothetical protein